MCLGSPSNRRRNGMGLQPGKHNHICNRTARIDFIILCFVAIRKKKKQIHHILPVRAVIIRQNVGKCLPRATNKIVIVTESFRYKKAQKNGSLDKFPEVFCCFRVIV